MLPDEIRAFQSLLQPALKRLLEQVSEPLRKDMVIALSTPGKLLSPPASEMPSGVWSLMTLAWASYLQPDADLHIAIQSSLAVECLLCAFDLLDDIEDGDSTLPLQLLGIEKAANVATGLLFLAQRALCPDATKPSGVQEKYWRLWNTFIESNLIACNGQHQDLLAEQQSGEDYQLEDVLMMVEAKSGALMRLTCLLGALSVNVAEEVCAIVADLGLALGVAHQLDNDAHDLAMALKNNASLNTPEVSETTIKSDLKRNKKTLPIVIATQQQALQSGPASADKKSQEELLEEAIRATWGACLVYRNHVGDALKRLRTFVDYPLSPALVHLIGVV